jgi:hypothetical protein
MLVEEEINCMIEEVTVVVCYLVYHLDLSWSELVRKCGNTTGLKQNNATS